MSSERVVRIYSAENLRFPEEGSSSQGKSGPKPRARAVGDGQQVEIPAPPKFVILKWGRRRMRRARRWLSVSKQRSLCVGKSAHFKDEL